METVSVNQGGTADKRLFVLDRGKNFCRGFFYFRRTEITEENQYVHSVGAMASVAKNPKRRGKSPQKHDRERRLYVSKSQ